jgi:CheY-like chemotaxis protein
MARDGSEQALGGSEEHNPVILLVEDESLLRMNLSDHLEDCGFVPIEAGNAEEAIKIIESRSDIDLVFTDVQMPGDIDGFGLAKWIRENRPELAVFVASGYAGKFDLAKELCAGEQFFSKPYDFDFIVAKTREHIAGRRRAKT